MITITAPRALKSAHAGKKAKEISGELIKKYMPGVIKYESEALQRGAHKDSGDESKDL